jgi:hypothetical protein
MITEAGPLNLRIGPSGLSCKIHPSVLVTICDSYIRRPSGARRVIGTLLGYAIEDSVFVKACYTEISEEDEAQVRICSLVETRATWSQALSGTVEQQPMLPCCRWK